MPTAAMRAPLNAYLTGNMPPSFLQIILLGLIQGAAELLPVSSSAHVIVAEKLMKLNPADPQMTFLLVMLHTGTMLAVIVYFWRAWRATFLKTTGWLAMGKYILIATACTLAVGGGLKLAIEHLVLGGGEMAEIEQLFSSLPLIAGALAAAGVLILVSAKLSKTDTGTNDITVRSASWIGLVQGVCVPFRGFSRSGSTISTAMLVGVGRRRAEEFSFALAVVITPLAIAKEFYRLIKTHPEAAHPAALLHMMKPGFVGFFASFVAGVLALRWLSTWLESGRWLYFGYYCLGGAGVILVLSQTVLR